MKLPFVLVIFVLHAFSGWSQSTTDSTVVPSAEFHREIINLHLNTTFFLAGETLLFKVHCLNADDSAKQSSLSSVAYIELVGEDGRPAAQLKVVLKNGVGSGDFFFGEKFASGNYTLMAYTKWMRNFSQADFFRCNVTVLNPEIRSYTFGKSEGKELSEREASSSATAGVVINFDKKGYDKRSKVSLEVVANKSAALNLSINVRVFDPELKVIRNCDPGNTQSSRSKQISFLPDLRGELISGRITDKNGDAVASRLVTLSSPSTEFAFLISTTDKHGKYYFNATRLKADHFLLGMYQEGQENYFIINDDSFLDDYSDFTPPKLSIDTGISDLIRRRHLSTQVENAFYSMKKDSVLKATTPRRFYATPDKIYHLDEYTRFTTMEDVFREIIPEVVVKKRDKDFSLTLKNLNTGFKFNNPPLILVDGIPVSNANIIMTHDPLVIKDISLMARHYFYGGLEADGIMSIETYAGDGKNIPVEGMTPVKYIQPLSPKIYSSPDYERSIPLKRIPDFRTQLYWDPFVNILPGESRSVSFFTGDLAGTYFVEIFGKTSSGECIYWKESFMVR
jgi:hypothetical protein